MGTIFLNGLFTGASLNYTLAHVLHLTPSQTHLIVISLIATSRGFAGSFGSAIGGGIFKRILLPALQDGFKKAGLRGRDDLIVKLLGSPALIASLTGVDKEIAIESYAKALRILFITGGGFAILTIFIQAGTGWTAPNKQLDEEVNEPIENGHSTR
jgi:hypothetical protein